MTGLGGLNKTPNGVVIGLVQMQLPNVVTPADLKAQAERVAALIVKARRSSASMDLVVFPEYSLHGLSMDTNPAIMCSMDGPEVALFRATCREQRIWGCFSLMEHNPGGYPHNSGIIIDDRGELRLYYRNAIGENPSHARAPCTCVRVAAIRDHIQATIKIAAEAPGGNLLLEIAVGRSHEAHVDGPRFATADAQHLMRLEHDVLWKQPKAPIVPA
jgi:Carbon-nitrogen hydrolase